MIALLFGAVVVLSLAACTSDDDGADGGSTSTSEPNPTIETHLTDAFLIDIASATANAGEVAFEVGNTGQLLHEFLVIRTDLAEDALPGGQVSAQHHREHHRLAAGPEPVAPD